MPKYICVDLEGHLSEWEAEDRLADPDPVMGTIVKSWMKVGIEIKLMTYYARPRRGKKARIIKQWCLKHFGQEFKLLHRNLSNHTRISY